jgi:hypothetical protein
MSGDDMNDRTACYLRVRDVQMLLVLEERIHEVVSFLNIACLLGWDDV